MATIEDAIRQGILLDYAMPDHELRTAKRRLLASLEFFDWLDETPALLTLKEGGRTLHEQAEQMLCDLRCLAKPGVGDLRRMIPDRSGVVKAHPPKLRLYGWIASGPLFVAITGALESETKADSRLNDQKRDEVLAFAARYRLTGTMLRGEPSALFTS